MYYNITKMKIELSGPEGNAFYLMSLVSTLGHQLGLSNELTNAIITEMKASDYKNLVKTFAKNFGMMVEIYQDGKLYDWESDYVNG